MPTTRTLAPAVSIGNYPQTGRVTVEERIAKRLGSTPGTAHQWMYGEQRANKRAAAIRRTTKVWYLDPETGKWKRKP